MIRAIGPTNTPKLNLEPPVPTVGPAGAAVFELPDLDAGAERERDPREANAALLAGALGRGPEAQDVPRPRHRDGADDRGGVEVDGGRKRRGGDGVHEPLARKDQGGSDGDARLAAEKAGTEASKALTEAEDLGVAELSAERPTAPAKEPAAGDKGVADAARAPQHGKVEARSAAKTAGEGGGQGADTQGGKGESKANGAAAGGDKQVVKGAEQAAAAAPAAQAQTQAAGVDPSAQAGTLGVADQGSLARLAGQPGAAADGDAKTAGLKAVGDIDLTLGPDAVGSAAARGAAQQKVVAVTPGQALADQLADAVRDLKQIDGAEDVIRFKSNEFGNFSALVRMDGRELIVHLRADDAATRAMLAERLPEVRAALERAGLASGGVDVRADSGGGQSERHSQSGEPGEREVGVSGAGRRPGGARRGGGDPSEAPAGGRLHLIL